MLSIRAMANDAIQISPPLKLESTSVGPKSPHQKQKHAEDHHRHETGAKEYAQKDCRLHFKTPFA
jgi:hypothetical protein